VKNVVYIHGANSSARSFKYIQKCLPDHKFLNIEYSVDVPLKVNISKIQKRIQKEFATKKVSIVGHSLGGIIAIGLHNKLKSLDRTVTISAPFGGSKIVEYFRWICPRYQMFEDVKPTSSVIMEIKRTIIKKPVLSLVTTGGGNPLLGESNDGTVTVRSQKAIRGLTYINYDLNHFEVLLSDRVINKIEDFLDFAV